MTRTLRRLLPLAAALLLAVPAVAQIPAAKAPAAPTFKELDADKDGRVSLEEVMAYAKGRGTLARPFSVSEVDKDHDGVLTPEELRAAGQDELARHGAVNVKDLDIRGDGYVSQEDLDEYFRRKGRAAHARADADKDSYVREPEFALFRF